MGLTKDAMRYFRNIVKYGSNYTCAIDAFEYDDYYEFCLYIFDTMDEKVSHWQVFKEEHSTMQSALAAYVKMVNQYYLL
ncbi:MAG: hypothetical protein J6W21_08510 [Bacteroidaceae bacterium]|nr:hypothetical protein [Bacteroidaceae bacterium]